DLTVTGVQTCALPIYRDAAGDESHGHHPRPGRRSVDDVDEAEAVGADEDHAALAAEIDELLLRARPAVADLAEAGGEHHGVTDRSEERRVGKECRSRR